METKKLTAKDLMIGDYVMAKKEPIRIATPFGNETVLHQLTLYGYTSDGAKAGPFLETELTPIPLTAEILEKNGWYIPTNSCWWHNDEIDFYLVGYTNGDFGIYTDGDSEFSNLCRINHVHELQNLYRICRFNKEIVL